MLATITGTSLVRLLVLYFLGGQLQVGWKTTPLRRVRYLQRNLPVHLYLSSPKPRHTPGGTVRGGARQDGGDGQHRTPTTALFAQGKKNSLTP